MEGQVDESVGVAEIHLHPVELCVQIHGHSMRQNFHFRVRWLDRAPLAIVIEDFFKKCGEGLGEDLADSDR